MDFDAYIKAGMDELKADVKNIEATLIDIQLDVKAIQIETRQKTAIYGILGGFIPALGVAIYFLLS